MPLPDPAFWQRMQKLQHLQGVNAALKGNQLSRDLHQQYKALDFAEITRKRWRSSVVIVKWFNCSFVLVGRPIPRYFWRYHPDRLQICVLASSFIDIGTANLPSNHYHRMISLFALSSTDKIQSMN